MYNCVIKSRSEMYRCSSILPFCMLPLKIDNRNAASVKEYMFDFDWPSTEYPMAAFLPLGGSTLTSK